MKIVFQVLFTLIILIVGIWLFTFIPTPSESIQGAGIAGIVFFPLAIAFYVSMVGVLGISLWNLIAFIFKEKQYREDKVREDTESKKNYTYNPDFKAKIQELNTAVKHTDPTTGRTVSIPNRKSSLLFTTFKVGSWIVGISFASAFAIIAFFTFVIKVDSHKSELKKYFIHYEAEDYNDSRIKYYVHELDINSQKLIHSDNIYDDVVANIKRGISLECIKVFRKEHNATKKHQADMQIENFMLNARNRSTTSDDMREISIRKEKFLRYNHPRSSYGLSSPSLKLQESCKKIISVNSIFQQVMPLYIQYEEKNLEKARTYALTYSTSSKYLTSKEKWVKALHEKYPQYTHTKKD